MRSVCKPMDLLIALVQALFRMHNAIYRLTGLEHRLPHTVPRIAPEEAARGGAWGYLRSGEQRLFYRRWLPQREPYGALLAVHGAGAHGGHFRVIGEHLGPR